MPMTPQCIEAGRATRFKPGQFGSKSPRWKGGFRFIHYGITDAQYEELLFSQGGGCAICGVFPKKNKLSVDHNHTTGKVRGLLCPPCNRFLEQPARLRMSLEYLRGYENSFI